MAAAKACWAASCSGSGEFILFQVTGLGRVPAEEAPAAGALGSRRCLQAPAHSPLLSSCVAACSRAACVPPQAGGEGGGRQRRPRALHPARCVRPSYRRNYPCQGLRQAPGAAHHRPRWAGARCCGAARATSAPHMLEHACFHQGSLAAPMVKITAPIQSPDCSPPPQWASSTPSATRWWESWSTRRSCWPGWTCPWPRAASVQARPSPSSMLRPSSKLSACAAGPSCHTPASRRCLHGAMHMPPLLAPPCIPPVLLQWPTTGRWCRRRSGAGRRWWSE